MKVFVSMKVPRSDGRRERLADLAAQETTRAGHSPFVAYREIIQAGNHEPERFMPFVRQHLRSADLLLALYEPELRGGLIELGMAYAWQVPIWLAYPAGEQVSSSALGCAQRTLDYVDEEDFAARPPGWLLSHVAG